MLINRCPVEEYESIVLAVTAAAVALARPRDGQVVTGQGHPS